MQKFDVPIEATTFSLEALKNYSVGMTVRREKGVRPRPLSEAGDRARPRLPAGVRRLTGINIAILGQPSVALEYARKAYQLRDRVTERREAENYGDLFYCHGRSRQRVQNYELWKTEVPARFRALQW